MSGNSDPPARKTPRWKAWLQNLALAGFSVLLCLAVIEGVLRLNGYGNVEIYVPDPRVFWKLKPNQNCYTKIGHKPVHINSQGTRGPEFDPVKPANTLRILSLGDSRTFGWGLTEAETYSGRLEQLLRQYLGGRRRVEVINAGVNAWSYDQINAYFRHTALRYQPDIVVLAAANGWTQFSDKSSPQFIKQFMWRVRLKNLLRRSAIYHYVMEVKLKEVYARYRSKFIPVDPAQDALFKEQQQKDPAAVFRQAVESLCTTARANGIQPVLLALPLATDFASTNAQPPGLVHAETSHRLNVPLVDVTPEIAPGAATLYLEADPVHLNAPGNEIIARRLFASITNLLTR
jgi:lysophospholipase L1-like esterase